MEAHVTNTGSQLAKELLGEFSEVVGEFSIVTPRDYANVLKVRAKAMTDGIDPDSPEVWERILEVTNG